MCSHCSQPLAADANFCAFCGNPVAADELAGSHAIDDTVVRPRPVGDDRPADA
jgi:hypothetical protein